MKQEAIYYRDAYRKEPFKIEYDDEAPCKCCGEPVISASMGGTAICPWCDCGNCRYCGMTIFVIREELDGGESKRKLLEHMRWHRKRNPELNNILLSSHRRMNALFKNSPVLMEKETNKNIMKVERQNEDRNNSI